MNNTNGRLVLIARVKVKSRKLNIIMKSVLIPKWGPRGGRSRRRRTGRWVSWMGPTCRARGWPRAGRTCPWWPAPCSAPRPTPRPAWTAQCEDDLSWSRGLTWTGRPPPRTSCSGHRDHCIYRPPHETAVGPTLQLWDRYQMFLDNCKENRYLRKILR